MSPNITFSCPAKAILADANIKEEHASQVIRKGVRDSKMCKYGETMMHRSRLNGLVVIYTDDPGNDDVCIMSAYWTDTPQSSSFDSLIHRCAASARKQDSRIRHRVRSNKSWEFWADPDAQEITVF